MYKWPEIYLFSWYFRFCTGGYEAYVATKKGMLIAASLALYISSCKNKFWKYTDLGNTENEKKSRNETETSEISTFTPDIRVDF